MKILVVDDEQIVREHFAEQIPWEEAGFLWMGAAINGQEAIAMMERELPHLVLTDITMPIMDGLEFAQYVKTRWPHVRIIFLTAHDEFAYAQRAVVLGAKNYLLKMGLSQEQVLQACKAVAEEIQGDWMKEDLHNRRIEQQRQEEWTARNQLIQRMVSEPASATSDSMRQINEWIPFKGSYCSVISVGWDWYWVFHENSLAEEAFEHMQWLAGEALEQREDFAETSIQVAVFPYRNSRLTILVTCPMQRGYAFFQFALHEFVRYGLEKTREIVKSDCFVFVSAITSQMEQVAKQIAEGQARLQDYFYSGKAVMANQDGMIEPEPEPDSVERLEQIARMTKSLHNREWREFMTMVEQLTTLRDPAQSSDFLLAVARGVLENGMKVPEPHKKSLRMRLELVNTWQAYCHWWELAVDYLAIPSTLFEQKNAVRREIAVICGLIANRYNEDLSIADLADAVHLNPAYVGQLFKQETGEYLSDYISRIRMHKAKELLGKTELKIYEIAQAVGITDYRYFCKMFKLMVGVTPTEYKRSR
ncbi:response regulator [Paenibacillus contaminans]|nr:response regulator [Paenibacillus contaminans]